jgi:hypothetical protein
MPTELGIVIVNYKTAGLTAACLRSLAPELAPLAGTRVVVVDNASGDGSAERLADEVRASGWAWATVVESPRNGGFAAGNNVGLAELDRGARPDWVLLLNPDTIVRPGALAALLALGRSRPRVGIVGAGLEYADGSDQHAAFRFPSIWSELEGGANLGLVSRLLARSAVLLPHAAAPRRSDWVSGACLLVRREALDQIGKLDDGFFLYYEEVDLCRRAAAAGWECWQEPRARVVHLIGQATGAELGAGARRPRYVLDSRRRYFLKHHGGAYAAAADLAWLAGMVTWQVRAAVGLARRRPAPGVVTDFLQHSVLRRASR